MKVIKHGKEYNPRQVACKKCECVYEWEEGDVKVAASGNASLPVITKRVVTKLIESGLYGSLLMNHSIR